MEWGDEEGHSVVCAKMVDETQTGMVVSELDCGDKIVVNLPKGTYDGLVLAVGKIVFTQSDGIPLSLHAYPNFVPRPF